MRLLLILNKHILMKSDYPVIRALQFREPNTWKDFYVLKKQFPPAIAWGPAASQVGGSVTTSPDGGVSPPHLMMVTCAGVQFKRET
jgi:hypothetical protein